MAPVIVVHFTFEGVGRKVAFEHETRAIRFARSLGDIQNVDRVAVVDDLERETLYESEGEECPK